MAEHKAVERVLPVIALPACPRCSSSTRSKGLALRKRMGAWLRLARCTAPGCRTVVVLLPAWAAVRLGATLGEVEHVIASREQGGTWRQAAVSAKLEHCARKYRRWFGAFRDVMRAVLPRLPGLALPPDGGGGWLVQLRTLLGVCGDGALLALRQWLYRHDGAVLGPTCLVALDRGRARGPPSP